MKITSFRKYSRRFCALAVQVCLSLVLLPSAKAQLPQGASTPFTTYEAEAGTLSGGASVVALIGHPPTEFSSPELEASGHAYVQLSATGQSVTWTNNSAVSYGAVNLRFSIPDSAAGGGTTGTLDLYVNGVFRQAINLSSAQCWLYETASDYDGQNQSPSYGHPHKFWDDTHFVVSGAPIAPGSTVTLQEDSTNTSAFYWLDCVDLEPLPAPLIQPANSLSITSYGAVANNPSVDCTSAVQNCINAAKTAGKIVWVPSGIFYLNTYGGIGGSNVTIEGAGPWYSTLYRQVPFPDPQGVNFFYGSSDVIQNICLDTNGRANTVSDGGRGSAMCLYGSNWLVNNVWVQHLNTGVWADGTNGTVQNCRMLDTWGDGINVNNQTTSYVGNNIMVANNFVRGSGDDGIAINSVAAHPVMTNVTVTNNTTVAPWWAHGLGVYGGSNDVVSHNLLTDSVRGTGMAIGVFSSTGSPLVSGIVQSNAIIRGGGFGYATSSPALGIGTSTETNSVNNLYVGGNIISNPMFDGIHLYSNKGTANPNVYLENNIACNPVYSGVFISSIAVGEAIINSTLVANPSAGYPAFLDQSANLVLDTATQYVDAPVEAVSSNSTSGTGTETCTEGGQDVYSTSTGSYSVYSNVSLNHVTGFVARVASSSGGSIAIHLDSATGTQIGTCTVPNTNGNQNWSAQINNLSGATGYHNVYFVYTGNVRLEWFKFLGNTNMTEGASYNSQSGAITVQACTEGFENLSNITAGSYTVYNNVDLTGVASFAARVANGNTTAGSVAICLDSPTGTQIGTCVVPPSGGSQNWTTQICNLSGATGFHNIYLVYTGGFNLRWFAFQGYLNGTEADSYNSMSGGITLETCSEGGQDLTQITTGAYTVYNNVNLNDTDSFAARVASSNAAGGSIAIHLDSPTGTVIGTCPVPNTGGGQTWTTQTCNISGATGHHNVYFVYAGSLNLESFSFQGTIDKIEGASNNGVSGPIGTETCSEGGLDVMTVRNGNYVLFNGINLNGIKTLNLRVANGNITSGTISAYLDSPTGTLIGSCTVASTGGWQNWVTNSFALTATSGNHNVYLVFTGTGDLPNLEWLEFSY